MIERSFGHSGYKARKTEHDRSLRVWTRSYECVIYLDEDEARQLVDDIKREFFDE